MTTRILNWFFSGNPDMPAFYVSKDSNPEGLRVYAPNAPGAAECQIDIRADGVSILSHYAKLGGQQHLEEMAGTFATKSIAEGAVVTCHVIDTGGANNISVQLELESLSED